jgi:hypothetical protein
MTTDLLNTNLNDDSRAITPERMTDHLARELIQELDLGDWELNDWQAKFVESNLQREHFSLKQKEVIYKMARRFNLL